MKKCQNLTSNSKQWHTFNVTNNEKEFYLIYINRRESYLGKIFIANLFNAIVACLYWPITLLKFERYLKENKYSIK